MKKVRELWAKWREQDNVFNRFWDWASRPKDATERRNRFRALKNFTRGRINFWKKVLSKDPLNRKEVRNHIEFWVKKNTVYREEYKKAKKEAKEGKYKWESWMSNGYNANVIEPVRTLVAYGIIEWGLSVSSLYRATVIPQSNPWSLHGPNTNPGQAADLVGAKMQAFQEYLCENYRGDANFKELIGPNNSTNLSSGGQYTLSEGSFLEDLHDSHTHIGLDHDFVLKEAK